MQEVTIWHNPRCGKSRDGLKYLEEKGLDVKVIKYLNIDISKDDLKEVLLMLGIGAKDLLRTKEKVYKELDLKNETDEEKLIEAMVENKKLIERPIVIKDGSAVVARPVEKIEELF